VNEYRYALGEKYAEVEGLKLCYQDIGQGETVVIIPGLGTSIDFWQLNIPTLAGQFRVAAVDPPGFGKSDKPDASYELSWMNSKILAFLDARGVGRFSVIGGSMGGHLALLLALDYPDRVNKLVMMGSTGDWPPPGPLLEGGLRALWNEQLVTDYLRGSWPDVFHKIIQHPTAMTEQLLRYQMALRADYDRFWPEGRASARAIRSIFFSSCRDRLADVRVPALLIWGASDQIHTADHARFMHERIPNSSLVIVGDSGHEVMIDQTEQFNAAVVSFLKTGFPGGPAVAMGALPAP
jgi:4,5:9,10-diseco-3-hydroxy-5,9,17-trioxoandrosta-1(10),2-diene-4-oate hydrolase